MLTYLFKDKKKINKQYSDISIKKLVQKTFPNHVVREKNEQIMLCEIDHRNEPRELAFIRINPYFKTKEILDKGNFIIATYPKIPTAKELKKDIQHKL
ncbi:hypothetical protein F4V57_14650 [Acinetobacter qingfengensis]|nr:hypothetical protein F4V57_14650 [Acinetobacter qingfengensis]